MNYILYMIRGDGKGKLRFETRYFVMVMATGIISLDAGAAGLNAVAIALFALNCITYPLFWFLLVREVIHSRGQLLSRRVGHAEAMEYLAIPAGTCVLGAQVVTIAGSGYLAVMLLCFGLILWFLFGYFILVFLILQEQKPAFSDAVNGTWLLLPVSTESLSVLASLLVPGLSCKALLTFSSVVFLLMGATLYFVIAPMIFRRLVFLRMAAHEFEAPYWIAMGGAAITALAASLPAENGTLKLFALNLEFLPSALAVLFWSIATWWMPLLLFLQVISIQKSLGRVRYEPGQWSLVFPVGMYVMCTDQVGRALGLHSFEVLASWLVFPALAIWAFTFLGLATSEIRSLLHKNRGHGR